MSEEARRAAMGLQYFASDTRRKVFICNDRREYKYLQGEVQKLEKRKANNMKKHDDEIKDWKEILKQLQHEKEGAESIQCLIEVNRETFKSSLTTRKQDVIKSVRRSLAPRTTQNFSHKPTINHQLISKSPSIPRKVKFELLKREQIRLNEKKISINEIKPRKCALNTNVFLDDAVAMYAKLRKEITAGPEKREVLSFAQKLKSKSSKETARPITVPCGHFKGLGTKELEDPLIPRRIKRSKTFGGFVPTAQRHSSLQRTRKRDKGRFTFNNIEARSHGLRIVGKGNAVKNTPTTNYTSIKHKKLIEPLKFGEKRINNATPQFKTNHPKKESQEESANDGVVRMPKVHISSPSDYNQDVKKFKEKELKSLTKEINKINVRDNSQEADLQEEEREEMSSKSCTSDEEGATAEDNLTCLDNNYTQTGGGIRDRRLSDSTTLLPIKYTQPASLRRLKAKGLLKTDLPHSRRDSESKAEQRFPARKLSVAGSARRHSQPSSISLTRLSEIISEKILEQVTNAKKRLSISSNKKTSILKSYARMLQKQLQMDDVPDSDSPDFSETPFMRSKMAQHEITNDSKAIDQGIQSEVKTAKYLTIWKSQLQVGALQSSFNYSEIKEENVLKDQERRRLSVPAFLGAAGITRKEQD